LNEWYAKLTPEQQKNCEIQNADTQLDEYTEAEANPTPHKIRYEIQIRKEILNKIFSEHDGIPSGQEYDYICGSLVGSRFTTHPHTFEFDDRSPDKYLNIGSYAQDVPPIDLDSIRF
jgi:hypothetical protein